MNLKMPFPYFGGKTRVADRVWQLLGVGCRAYVEPFAGSCAVLLARPSPVSGAETINDASCHVVNALRAIRSGNSADLAHLCIGPVAEVDMEATHYALVTRADELRNRLGNPDYFDLQLASWWIKGASAWIGGGWCTGDGPHAWSPEVGWHQRGGATKPGISRPIPALGGGVGVNRKIPHVGSGVGVNQAREKWLREWLSALADRMSRVRVACGDFERVLCPTTLDDAERTAVFLDPPYAGTEYVYGATAPVSQRVRAWCRNADPALRIVLAGRGAEHDELLADGWRKEAWSGAPGYAGPARIDARHTEALWYSRSCWVRAPIRESAAKEKSHDNA